MQQLSGADAAFLYADTPNAQLVGGGLYIYDQSTAPGGRVTFTGILDNLEKRLHLARMFRRKLVRVPMDLDHPYWIDDPSFDLEYHVRHIALPHPGDWRQLCIQTARIVARPLDLSKPLWEFYVIEGLDGVEGLPNGSFAILQKGHHASMDGIGGMEMMTAMHDLTPAGEPPAPGTGHEWQPEEEPAPWELLGRAWFNQMTVPARMPEVMSRMVGGLGRIPPAELAELAMSTAAIPRTRFNANVSPHRVIEGRRIPLADLRQLKAAVPGATVNDALLAIIGGGLRRYLEAKDELPEDSLVAMVPISVRTEEERGVEANRVSAMFVPIGTDVATPIERLVTVEAATKRSKALSNALDARALSEMTQMVPGALSGLAARLGAELGTANTSAPLYNTMITNVPGPQVPLYSNGARLVAQFGFGMIYDGLGLLNIINSYCGDITISITADKAMMPDPSFYADCIMASYEELSEATGGSAKAPPGPPAPAKRPSASSPKKPAKVPARTTKKRAATRT